jgi:drug/metabolite transporter (DMT)-like permease
MRQSHKAYAALAAAGILWGIAFVFGKIALRSMPVGAMVTWRFIIASVVLLPFVMRRSTLPLLRPRLLVALTIAGVLYVPIQFLLQFEGLALTTVTHASLVVAIFPGLIAAGSCAVLRQRIRLTTVVALALSLAGALLIAIRPNGVSNAVGDLLVALSLVVGVAWILITQRYLTAVPAVEMTALMVNIGTAVLVVVELVRDPRGLVSHYPLGAWCAVIALGLLSTAVATISWNIGLRSIDTNRAGVFLNLEPLVGALCGVLFFSEPLGTTLCIGAAMILGGAYAVTIS